MEQITDRGIANTDEADKTQKTNIDRASYRRHRWSSQFIKAQQMQTIQTADADGASYQRRKRSMQFTKA